MRAVQCKEGDEEIFGGLGWREGHNRVVTFGFGIGLRGCQTRNVCVKVYLLC